MDSTAVSYCTCYSTVHSVMLVGIKNGRLVSSMHELLPYHVQNVTSTWSIPSLQALLLPDVLANPRTVKRWAQLLSIAQLLPRLQVVAQLLPMYSSSPKYLPGQWPLYTSWPNYSPYTKKCMCFACIQLSVVILLGRVVNLSCGQRSSRMCEGLVSVVVETCQTVKYSIIL